MKFRLDYHDPGRDSWFSLVYRDIQSVYASPLFIQFCGGISKMTKEEVQLPEPVQRVQKLASNFPASIPPAYVSPQASRPPLDAPRATIPLVDLSLPDLRHQIGQACEEWGVFHVINHGIPLSLIQSVQRVSKELFDLPYEEKEVYANTPESFVGYGSSLRSPNTGVLSWGDYFLHHLIPFTSYDADSWPEKPAPYREIMSEYGNQVYGIMRTLLAAIAENLRLPFSYVQESFGGEDGLRLSLKVNYYPPCPQPSLAFGASSHSDAGILTVLLQDEVEGLQVFKDGAWYGVETIPGGLVVNIGDQLEIFSNGKYKSVEHQVVTNSKKVRMSWATFLAPSYDAVVSPTQLLINEGNPPLYEAVCYKIYLANHFTKGTKGNKYVYSHSLNK